jgi:hypothetical protein
VSLEEQVLTHKRNTYREVLPCEEEKEGWPFVRQGESPGQVSLRENQLCQHRGLGLPVFKTVRKGISVV